jgi:hypothetical protein
MRRPVPRPAYQGDACNITEVPHGPGIRCYPLGLVSARVLGRDSVATRSEQIADSVAVQSTAGRPLLCSRELRPP